MEPFIVVLKLNNRILILFHIRSDKYILFNYVSSIYLGKISEKNKEYSNNAVAT